MSGEAAAPVAAVRAFSDKLAAVSWFASLGNPPMADEETAVADYLDGHSAVESVIHPDLMHGEALRRAETYLKGGFGALVGFHIKGGKEAGAKFIDALLVSTDVGSAVRTAYPGYGYTADPAKKRPAQGRSRILQHCCTAHKGGLGRPSMQGDLQ